MREGKTGTVLKLSSASLTDDMYPPRPQANINKLSDERYKKIFRKEDFWYVNGISVVGLVRIQTEAVQFIDVLKSVEFKY